MQERHSQCLQMFTCFSTCVFFTDSPHALHVKTTMAVRVSSCYDVGPILSSPHSAALARQDPRCHQLQGAFQLLSPPFNSLAVRLSPTLSLSCCPLPALAQGVPSAAPPHLGDLSSPPSRRFADYDPRSHPLSPQPPSPTAARPHTCARRPGAASAATLRMRNARLLGDAAGTEAEAEGAAPEAVGGG